ncbi:MAG: SDR family NAD(P)-dependent oxidoreductase [Gemmatimonadota bacterium]
MSENRIQGKRVLITGASAGIGAACARRLAEEGAGLALWARRLDRLEGLADEIARRHGRDVHIARVDIRNREHVEAAAEELLRHVGVPHVLLNNAGLAAGLAPVQEGDPEDWDVMVDTNVKGLLYATRALLPHMIEAGRGHVVNVGSTAGHTTYPRGNVYAATKFAVRALTEGMNLDLSGTPLRVSSVDPGYVKTEFSLVRFQGDEERAEAVYRGFQPLSPEDVADAVAYVINAPEHVNVFDMVLLPTAQRNIYVVDREEG